MSQPKQTKRKRAAATTSAGPGPGPGAERPEHIHAKTHTVPSSSLLAPHSVTGATVKAPRQGSLAVKADREIGMGGNWGDLVRIISGLSPSNLPSASYFLAAE